MTNAENLRNELMSAIAAAGSTDALEAVRLQALGKKGSITQLMKTLGGMDPDARREAGQAINTLKSDVAGAIDARKADLEGGELDIRLMAEKIDVTLPERPQDDGRVHPISQVIDEMTAIFCEMGFSVAEGPEYKKDLLYLPPPKHPP